MKAKRKFFLKLEQKDMQDKTQKAQKIGAKIDKLDFIKLKTFQITKETMMACIDNLL